MSLTWSLTDSEADSIARKVAGHFCVQLGCTAPTWRHLWDFNRDVVEWELVGLDYNHRRHFSAKQTSKDKHVLVPNLHEVVVPSVTLKNGRKVVSPSDPTSLLVDRQALAVTASFLKLITLL